MPAPDTVCEPDPPVARPSFWDELPVPDGVGPFVDDPAIDLALGLPRHSGLRRRLAPFRATSTPSLTPTGASSRPSGSTSCDAPELLEGVTSLVAFAPDGTQVVILVIPPEALTSNPDLEAAAELALPGQGFVVVAALGDD